MRSPTSPYDPVSREARRRRRRRAGRRRLALALGLLALLILAIGLGVGLSSRGGGTTGTTSTSISGSSTTGQGTGSTTAASGSTTTSEGTGSSGTSSTLAPGPLTFTASLTGAQEVPSVSTAATGTLTLTVSADRSKVEYVFAVKGIRNLTVARLHRGNEGENGETVATIYAGPTKTGVFTGKVAAGLFGAARLVGPLEKKTVSDLVALLEAGSVYLNVGTTAHRSGEIRGQLSSPAPAG